MNQINRASTSIVTEVPSIIAAEKPILQIQESVAKAPTRCPIKWITFAAHNKLHKDGRVYIRKDDDGKIVASSVSPYFEKFHTQIDPEIWGLVSAIKDKGYLTFSSCAGHPKRLMLGLAFPSDESRQVFRMELEKHNIPTLIFEEKDTVANNDVEISESGKYSFSRNKAPDNDLDNFRKGETTFFNNMFLRNYEQYKFLVVYMLYDYNYFLHPIKSYQTYKHIPKKAQLIQVVTDIINDVNFPRFPH